MSRPELAVIQEAVIVWAHILQSPIYSCRMADYIML